MSTALRPQAPTRSKEPRANPAYAIGRAAFGASMRAYFRRIEVRNPERLPLNGSLLIVANHPAALTDALVLGTQLARRVHFLAMSPLFKPWLRGVLMRAVGALPVYRRQDDPALMQQNELTFESCHQLFDQGGAVLVFPEGQSDSDRRLLQMKTGAARLALAQEQRGRGGEPLTLLPVGLYFEDRTRFQSEVIVSVGEPIPLAPYVASAASDSRAAVQAITQAIQSAIGSLIQVIPEPEFAHLVSELEHIYMRELQSRGDPRHELELKRRVAACVNHFRRTDPERVVAVGRQLKHYLRTLQALRLQDDALRELESRRDWRRTHARRVALAGLGMPLAVAGGAIHWLPFELCAWVAQKLAPHPSRISSAHILGVRLVPAVVGAARGGDVEAHGLAAGAAGARDRHRHCGGGLRGGVPPLVGATAGSRPAAGVRVEPAAKARARAARAPRAHPHLRWGARGLPRERGGRVGATPEPSRRRTRHA
jgi:1-acyl-sn-glycerol-3-phosphate acyltransferase